MAREENRIYLQEVRNAQEFFGVLEAVVRQYEAGVKSFHGAFAHEGVFYLKIIDIIKSMGSESPEKKALKKSELKEGESQSKGSQGESLSKAFQGHIPRLDLKIQ